MFVPLVVIETGTAMYIKPVAATVMGVFNNDVEHENGA
jgi:hypothetical protein